MSQDPSPANGHRAAYRVRFDEATPAGTARTSVLLRYAQDIAWAHSEALGFDRRWYRDRGLAWLVRAARLEVTAPIRLGAVLDVTTSVVAYSRAWARRRGEFRLDGEPVARVDTDWVLIDERGRITRIPETFGEHFPVADAGNGRGQRLTRVDLPAEPPAVDTRVIAVRPHELDPMDHVNNAVYLDWLEESLVAVGGSMGVLPRAYALEYAAAAAAGDRLEATTWRDASDWVHRIRRGDGDVFRARVALAEERG